MQSAKASFASDRSIDGLAIACALVRGLLLFGSLCACRISIPDNTFECEDHSHCPAGWACVEHECSKFGRKPNPAMGPAGSDAASDAGEQASSGTSGSGGTGGMGGVPGGAGVPAMMSIVAGEAGAAKPEAGSEAVEPADG